MPIGTILVTYSPTKKRINAQSLTEDCQKVGLGGFCDGRHEEVPGLGFHKLHAVFQEVSLVFDMFDHFRAAY